jgi:hypothetical protein
MAQDRVWLAQVWERAPLEMTAWAARLTVDGGIVQAVVDGDALLVKVGLVQVWWSVVPAEAAYIDTVDGMWGFLLPECECDELDRWCAHAVAAARPVADLLAADPTLFEVIAPPGWRPPRQPVMSAGVWGWLDGAFSAVEPDDRKKLMTSLAFFLHPDRRHGDPTAFAALQDAAARWADQP